MRTNNSISIPFTAKSDRRTGRRTGQQIDRAGFTLVEMLVSVALVLLMMSMFAAIFQLAAEATSTQRGISENDQRARSVSTTIRNDLDKRTVRNVMPFQANEDANSTPTRFDDRTGFIEIITNDPANGLDDTLLLTTSADMVQKSLDETPSFGHAEQLLDPADLPFPPATGHNVLVNNPNQPEMDDGVIIANQTARSKAAQVAYFVRNGNLYRRVLLLREPRERAGRELNPQPSFEDGTDPLAGVAYYTPGTIPTGTNAFWRDFDFSAVRVGGLAQFVGIESLNNAPGSTFYAIGKPHFRFGHSPTISGAWLGGHPRQFNTINTALSPEFTGFFLQEETSYPSDTTAAPPTGGFSYPHGNAQLPGTTTAVVAIGAASAAENGDPMDIRVNFTLNSRKVVEDFTDPATEIGGPRRSEDLLLANVHEFRIEIWDDRLGQWVFPGHNRFHAGLDGVLGNADDVPGDYHVARRYNGGYGPFGPAALGRGAAPASSLWDHTNHVFDTWHPGAISGAVGSKPNMPPFRPMTLTPPFRPDDTAETQTTAPFWTPSTINWADMTMTTWQSYVAEDTNGNGVLDPGEDTDGDGILGPVVFARTEDLNGDGDAADTFGGTPEDGWYDGSTAVVTTNGVLNNEAYGAVPAPPFGYGYYYRLVRSGFAANGPPNWQARPGPLITDDNFVGGTAPPGIVSAIWKAVPNLRPLKSVRITVRFVDPSSKQMRQSTIIHSLID